MVECEHCGRKFNVSGFGIAYSTELSGRPIGGSSEKLYCWESGEERGKEQVQEPEEMNAYLKTCIAHLDPLIF